MGEEQSKLIKIDDKPISSEQLTKELDVRESVMKEILQRQEEEKQRATATNPSALALSTTKHGTGDALTKVKKSVGQLFNLYLTNQFVARAVDVRADTMISMGFDIVGEDDVGVKACVELIKESGGTELFWQLGVNTDIAGDGFLEKVYNLNQTKITRLKHVHPLTLAFKTDLETDRIIVGKDKEPVGYVQIYIDKHGTEITKDIPKNRISHFKYNTLGDEFTGISVIQSGYDTIVRLMNMEYSAAEAAVKIANPIIVGMCNTKSPHQIAQWGTILGNISGRDQLFIPEGMTLDTLEPGNQNFNDYADYFLDAVVACFGVPKGILLGGTSDTGNRAQEVVLSRHFYNLIRRNQKYMVDFFNGIFREYAELAGFKAPVLQFEDIAEDSSVNADSSIKLFDAGIIDIDEAREMIGLEDLKDGSPLKIAQSEAKAIKKSDMETFFPETPGSPAGSQRGVKSKQKIDGNSLVKPNTK